MPDAPALTIPVRFNYGNAAADLKALNAQAAQQTKAAADVQVKAQQDAEKRRMQAAKDAAAFIAQVNRDLAAKTAASAKSTGDAEVAVTRDTEAKKSQAAKDAFAKWKAIQDAQHSAAMQSWGEQQAATKKTEQATRSFGNSLGDLMKAQITFSALKATVQAIGSLFKETSDYVRGMAKDFIALRQSMQEVATLSGKPGSNAFTLEEARKAQAISLKPEEWRDFQAEFLNYAGSQVSSDEKLGEGQKLTASQGKDYAARVAEFMKAGGVDPRKGAGLAGSILQQSRGESVDQLMQHFSRVANVAEKGNVSFGKATQDLGQIMGMGLTPEEAATLYTTISPAAEGEEGTATQAAVRAVREMKAKGTGDEYGVKMGMSPYASVKAFGANIQERKQAMMAAGMTNQMAEDEIAKDLQQKQIANDIREARGLVVGAGRYGTELGGFRKFEAFQEGTGADFEAKRKQRYEGSQPGRQAQRDADQAVAEAGSGERNSRIVEIRQEAATALKNEGRFERVEASDAARAAIAKFGGASVNEQLINERAIQMAQDQGGVPQNQRMLTNFGAGPSETDAAILRALNYQNGLMDNRALSAPPAQRGLGGGAR